MKIKKEVAPNSAVMQMEISKNITVCFPVVVIRQNGSVLFQMEDYLKLAKRVMKKGKQVWFVNVQEDDCDTILSGEVGSLTFNPDNIRFKVKPLNQGVKP